jgi:7-carboxy-7-deazaguanine synthase
MDVKCPASGEHGKMLWENFPCLTGRDEVKFVISTREDYEYAKDVLAKHRGEARWEALFSPAFGILPPERLAEWILEDSLDVRFQLQIHKFVWGPERRGV